MNVDDVVAQLLAGSLNEFTNARNAKAKELKAAGERDLAAEVAKLKKPPVAVWAVNQFARQSKPVLERLRRAGAGVVHAQSGAVSGRKNAAHEATLRRMQEMLRLAAVSGGETWDRLQRGALISEPRAGEDMLTAAFALGSAATGSPSEPRVKANQTRAARTAEREAAETERRIEMEHVLRTAKADEEAAQQTAQTARRLREEADRVAADARRAGERARHAEKELEHANARAKVSREAARKISPR